MLAGRCATRCFSPASPLAATPRPARPGVHYTQLDARVAPRYARQTALLLTLPSPPPPPPPCHAASHRVAFSVPFLSSSVRPSLPVPLSPSPVPETLISLSLSDSRDLPGWTVPPSSGGTHCGNATMCDPQRHCKLIDCCFKLAVRSQPVCCVVSLRLCSVLNGASPLDSGIIRTRGKDGTVDSFRIRGSSAVERIANSASCAYPFNRKK